MIDFLNNRLAKQSKTQPYSKLLTTKTPLVFIQLWCIRISWAWTAGNLTRIYHLSLVGFSWEKWTCMHLLIPLTPKVRDLFSLVRSLKYESEITTSSHFFPITFNVKYSRCFLSFIFYFKNAKMTHFPKSCSSKANIQHTPFRRLADSKVSSLWSCSLCPLGQVISKSKLKGHQESKRHFQVPGLGASCCLGSRALSHCALDQRWVLHFQLASVGLSNETEVQHLSLESALQAKGAASSQT